ncbi:hypothetical protein V6Z11_A05G215400 [Gossypium hirsutum]
MEGMNRIEPRRSLEASPSQLTSVNYIWSSVVAETTSNEWTDEKHSLYLNSMEASFINQLYDSVNLVGWNSQKEKLERPKSSRQIHCTSSGQFFEVVAGRRSISKDLDFNLIKLMALVLLWEALASTSSDLDLSHVS